MVESADYPYPPPKLTNRVLNLDAFGQHPDRAYEFWGRSTRESLTAILPDDYSFTGRRVLDFGCGAGRTLRHFVAESENADFWGTDIDRPSIEWLNGNLCPPLRAIQNDPDPPLPFESASFDLVYAISVFTHLASNSVDWLLELHRILEPGGLLIASYMGEFNSEEITGEEWDEDRIGMNVLRHMQSWDQGGPMVLMSDWWIREHWGRVFEIVELMPAVHGQTWALLRKKDVRLTAGEVLEPTGDPREFEALRHNLAQVQREVELGIDQMGREYEDSLSWRMTRPLRAVGRRIGKRSP